MRGNENPVFGEGRVGTVQLRSGGELALKNSDTVVTNADGLIIKHGDDPAENITVVPWTNVGYTRTWLTNEAQKEKKIRAEQRALNSSRPIIDEEELRKQLGQ